MTLHCAGCGGELEGKAHFSDGDDRGLWLWCPDCDQSGDFAAGDVRHLDDGHGIATDGGANVGDADILHYECQNDDCGREFDLPERDYCQYCGCVEFEPVRAATDGGSAEVTDASRQKLADGGVASVTQSENRESEHSTNDTTMSVQIGETETEQPASGPEPLYDTAKPVTWSRIFTSWLPERFAEALLDEHDIDYGLGGFRLVEIYNHLNDDEGTKVLMVDPDGTRVYIGEDATARDSNGLYGFVIRTGDRLPAIRTVGEATNLLKPAHVSAAEAKGATPLRQGEWFLVPADTEPESKIFSGEVAERPFGSSPLENHVPTEYALGVSEPEFLDRFFEVCPGLEQHVDTAKEAFGRVEQAYQIASLEDVELETDIPTFDEVREVAEPIYVRGTLRHRENDHYMESVGDGWHVAVTHDVDVFTAETDDLTEDTRSNPMRLD